MKRLTVIVGLVCSGLVVLAALVSLVWTPYNPRRVDPGHKYAPLSWTHLLGTDMQGMDTLSRLLVGAQTTLVVGVLAVAIAAIVGVPLGIFVGMGHRFVGEVVARGMDILFALPALLLAILLAAATGASVGTATIAIGVSTIPIFVRMTRAATLTIMNQDYILAAQVSGTPTPVIAVRHVLPNIAPLLGVQAAASFSMAILAEAGLSYLGLSAPPTTPTWGRMLKDANIFIAPTQAVIPGIAIAVAVLGFNMLGDGLRDYLDPRLKEVR
ncbi:MAG: ABC transporter permease [Propionibacteriaceae bacterium]|nr:ABC transporter permease [Propionibacteriaceae bacterium]